MSNKLLISFVLSTDLTLTLTQMRKRGIPESVIPTRTPARLASMLTHQPPFADGPLQGWRIDGSNKVDGYRLIDGGGVIAANIEANGILKVCWEGAYLDRITPPGQEQATTLKCAAALEWLESYIADLKTTVDRTTIRRIILHWLESIGFVSEGLPGLYSSSMDRLELLDHVLGALPEGEWGVWEAGEL